MVHINDLIKLAEDMKEKGICAKCIDSKTTWKHSCDKQICEDNECEKIATHETEYSCTLAYFCETHILERTKIGAL